MRILTFLAILLAGSVAVAAGQEEWHWVKATNTIKGWSISEGNARVVITGDQIQVELYSQSEGRPLELSLKGKIHDGKIVVNEIAPNTDYSGATFRGTLERKRWNEFSGTTGAESITLSDGWGMIGLTRTIEK
jgi:hypothetical protein